MKHEWTIRLAHLASTLAVAGTLSPALANPASYISAETMALSQERGVGLDDHPAFVFFGRPVLSESGTVAFEVQYDRAAAGPDADSAVWAWEAGELRLVAWQGDPSGAFARTEPPQVTAEGEVVFLARDAERQESLWKVTDGTLSRLIGEGDILSHPTGEPELDEFSGTPVVGQDFVCLRPEVDDAPHDFFPMWTNRWGDFDLIVPAGWRLPGTNWEDGLVLDLATDTDRRHAFLVRYDEPLGGSYYGAFRENSSYFDALAIQGDSEPIDPNLTFSWFKWLSQGGGVTTFFGSVEDDDTDDRYYGIWACDDALQRVVLQNLEAPGIVGSEISRLSHPFASDGGSISFTAALTGDGIDESNNTAIWRGTPDDLQIIAREGEHIPGLPGDVVIRDFQAIAVNEDYAALYVTLFGYTVGDNDRALLLIDPDGDKHLVTRVGDKFDVAGDGSDLRSVKHIGMLPADPEHGRSPLSASGTVAFMLEFFDGTSGVFTAHLITPCTGDIDGDEDTDQSDLGLLLASYEVDPSDPYFNEDADLNGDGAVDQQDLGLLLADYECDPHNPHNPH